MDTYLVFDLMRPPLFKMAYPSVAQARVRRDATMDGSMPLEPYQIISQYTLEPLLKSAAERIPNVAVKFGHELLSYTEDPDGVAAQVKRKNGETIAIRARYMVGCDGGSSTVRKQLGFKMEGEPHLLEMRQALFHCPELYNKVRAPRARHYHRIDDHWTLMIVQDFAQALHASCRRREGRGHDAIVRDNRRHASEIRDATLLKMGAKAAAGGALSAGSCLYRWRCSPPCNSDRRSRHEYGRR